MIISCLLPEPELNTYGTAMTTAVTVSPLAGVVIVEDRFATMPALKAVSAPITATYRPFAEEELHTSFEQAISERVLAVKRMLNLQANKSVASTPMLPHTAPLGSATVQQDVQEVVKFAQPRGKTLALLHANAWLRGLTYASFVLMLMLIGFDLMGMLVLFAR
ncbi:MAG TPA: hypothetical protein VGN15_07635 [Ktedonobacteraceae bacterium]|nr:hypothetical protein [Ktedonobacteraceae bacterium]